MIALATGLFSTNPPDGYPQPAGRDRIHAGERLHGNVFDEFGWGEFLIFQLEPESKVCIDSRYDMVYPQAVLVDYWTSSLCAVRCRGPRRLSSRLRAVESCVAAIRLHDGAAGMANRLSG